VRNDMAIINPKQARDLSDVDLDGKIESLHGELSRELAKKSTEGTATKTGKIRLLKRTIAMLLTIQNEKKKINKNTREKR